MLRSKIVSQPIPQHVLDAMSIIQEYLKEGGWVQAIINVGGGASFRLTDIHKDYLMQLNLTEERKP